MKDLKQFINEANKNINNFLQEFGKLMFDKYKDAEGWMSDSYLRVEFDEKDTPFKLKTDGWWRIDVNWKDKNCETVELIELVELPPNVWNDIMEDPTDVTKLSTRKQKLLFDFVKNHK